MADTGDDGVVDPLVCVLAPLTGEDADRRPAAGLRTAGGRGHDFAEATGNDR